MRSTVNLEGGSSPLSNWAATIDVNYFKRSFNLVKENCKRNLSTVNIALIVLTVMQKLKGIG
jgi:hypothetical protein